jgi:hypothetical protein
MRRHVQGFTPALHEERQASGWRGDRGGENRVHSIEVLRRFEAKHANKWGGARLEYRAQAR